MEFTNNKQGIFRLCTLGRMVLTLLVLAVLFFTTTHGQLGLADVTHECLREALRKYNRLQDNEGSSK